MTAVPMDGLAWLRVQATKDRWDRNDLRYEVHKATVRHEQEKTPSLARPSLNENTRRRGRLRIARGAGLVGARSRGLIHWFVPEGADWDLEPERSTRHLLRTQQGECPWGDHEGEYPLLESYNHRADEVHYEELEDWDIAPMRPTLRPVLTEFTPGDDEYARRVQSRVVRALGDHLDTYS
jgi:hypothetical protein